MISPDVFGDLAPKTFALTFDEPMDPSAIQPSVIVVTNGTLTSAAFTNSPATIRDVVVTPDGSGDVMVFFGAGAFADVAGNPTAAAGPFSVSFDDTPPTPTLTFDTFDLIEDSTIRITFDEDITGFDATDITVDGGTLGPLTGGPQIFAADITAVGTTDLIVSIPAGAACDATGTPSAATSVTGRFAPEGWTGELIRDFMTTRATALVAAQPDLRGLLGSADGTGQITVSKSRGVIQMFSRTDHALWAAVDAQWSNSDGLRSSYTHLTFGSHLLRQEDMVLGIMAQFDHAYSTVGAATVEGSGYLVGPYWVTRFDDVTVDARLLAGKTENNPSTRMGRC